MNLTLLVVRIFFSTAISAASPLSISKSGCKAIPNSPNWPSNAEWKALNSSLSGWLLSPTPPGVVCHPDQSGFNNVSCAAVAKSWTDSLYHAQQPITIDYNDDSCLPDAKAPCSVNGYPPYVVNASSATHVKKAVDFARKHNVRLTIKGTGHDFNGRSSAPNSLSIWTRHLRNIEFFDSFTPKGCSECKGVPAVKIDAGLQWRDVQKAAARRNLMVVGGADPNVGLGGYMTGGGHSPISSLFGLASDQALEFEVVTASGEILTVNQVDYKDLFWAMRGGGPSFAVIISATIKTFPTQPLTFYTFAMNTTSNSETYFEANAYFHSQLPRLSDGGAMGYYYALPKTPGVKDKRKQGMVIGAYLLPNKSPSEAESLFKPLVEHFRSDTYPDEVFVSGYGIQFPDFYSWFHTNPAQSVGTAGYLGSRLLGRHALTSNHTALVQALKKANSGSNFLLGHLIAGKGVRDVEPAGGEDAVLPAWRHAYTHVVLPVSWPFLNEKLKKQVSHKLTYEQVAGLRDISPDSGAYVNEADPNEPNWQEAFWGSHYSRLSSIKEKWDPEGVFYCFPCVGAEKWKVVNDRLCKA